MKESICAWPDLNQGTDFFLKRRFCFGFLRWAKIQSLLKHHCMTCVADRTLLVLFQGSYGIVKLAYNEEDERNYVSVTSALQTHSFSWLGLVVQKTMQKGSHCLSFCNASLLCLQAMKILSKKRLTKKAGFFSKCELWSGLKIFLKISLKTSICLLLTCPTRFLDFLSFAPFATFKNVLQVNKHTQKIPLQLHVQSLITLISLWSAHVELFGEWCYLFGQTRHQKAQNFGSRKLISFSSFCCIPTLLFLEHFFEMFSLPFPFLGAFRPFDSRSRSTAGFLEV